MVGWGLASHLIPPLGWLVPTLLSLLAQVPLAPNPSAADSFGMKEFLTIMLSGGLTLAITLLMRGWSGTDRAEDRLWKKVDDIEKAILRCELDIRDLQGYTEPIKEAVRLTIAGMVPRPNPLSEETNQAVRDWHEGRPLPPEVLKAASRELIEEAQSDPKLNESERMMFSATAASMNYDATKQETKLIRIKEGLVKPDE